MDKKDNQISQTFNFSSGAGKMALGPFVALTGIFMIASGILVAVISSSYGPTQTVVLEDGVKMAGKGIGDFFWNGPKEMVLSFKSKSKDNSNTPQPPSV